MVVHRYSELKTVVAGQMFVMVVNDKKKKVFYLMLKHVWGECVSELIMLSTLVVSVTSLC